MLQKTHQLHLQYGADYFPGSVSASLSSCAQIGARLVVLRSETPAGGSAPRRRKQEAAQSVREVLDFSIRQRINLTSEHKLAATRIQLVRQ